MEDEKVDFTKLKYVLYARKSTDDPKRQVRSIPDQIAECMQMAQRIGLHVIGKPIEETKSAKKPNQRPLFRQMLKDIRDGKYDAILSWNPDRLSRNMKEAGEIIDMVDENIIKDFKFVTHPFERSANGVMLLGMSFVLSKQYSDDLSQKVTRGVRRSFAEGKSPTFKHGYFRDEEGHYQPDNKNWEIICEAWKMRRKEEPLEAIADYMNSEGYERVIKNTGRKMDMDKRILSKIFRDPFYYGVMIQAGEKVDLRTLYDFKPAVSEEDFNMIQYQFYNRTLPYRKKRMTFYPLKRMVICSFCNRPMLVGASMGHKKYLYFRCETPGCQRKKKSIRSKVVFDFIYQLLEKGLDLSDREYQEYYDTMTSQVDLRRDKLLTELHSKEGALKAVVRESHDLSMNLLKQKFSDTVRQEGEKRIQELDAEKEQLTQDVEKLKPKIADPEKQRLSIEEFLNLSKQAATKVKSGDSVAKDIICRNIFLNFLVDEEKVLSYQAKDLYVTLLKRAELPSSRGERT